MVIPYTLFFWVSCALKGRGIGRGLSKTKKEYQRRDIKEGIQPWFTIMKEVSQKIRLSLIRIFSSKSPKGLSFRIPYPKGYGIRIQGIQDVSFRWSYPFLGKKKRSVFSRTNQKIRDDCQRCELFFTLKKNTS